MSEPFLPTEVAARVGTTADDGGVVREHVGSEVVGRVPLLIMTITKLFTNVAIRMPFPFLGTIAKDLNMSKARGGSLLGIGELAGLATFLIGRRLDRGEHRRWLVIGSLVTAVGCLFFSLHEPWSFCVGYALVSLGVGLLTAAGHTFLGQRVSFTQRGRVIGLYETSWAIALLVGGPLVAAAIRIVSWSTAFLLVAVLIVVTTPLMASKLPSITPMESVEEVTHGSFRRGVAAATVLTSLCMTLGAVMTFSSFGSWLDVNHGIGTGGLGAVAMSLGLVELAGSSLIAGFGDRFGKRRCVTVGALMMSVGAGVMIAASSTSRVLAVVGVLLFFAGFEGGYVSLLAVVSEVGGPKRGLIVTIDHTLVVVMRAAGAALGPWIAREDSRSFHNVEAFAIVLALAAAFTAQIGRDRTRA